MFGDLKKATRLTNSRRFGAIILALIYYSITATTISAQQITCFDLQSERGEPVFRQKAARKTMADPCRGPERKSSQSKDSLVEISLSGHVTHQNGVRMPGITLTLINEDTNISRTAVSDETGSYLFADLTFGHTYRLTPTLEGYQFFPSAAVWHGLVESQIRNFITEGPPPEEPPVAPGTPTLGWTSYYNDPANSTDYQPMIGRDSAGNIYLAGTSFTVRGDGDTDIVVSKIDANGNLDWSRQFNGTADYKDILRDMAVDSNGNVYLTGYTYSLASDGSNWRSYDYVTLKYDTDGNQLWNKSYEHRVAYNDYPRSLKIDGDGNVYVTGMSWDENVFADFATLKYDTDGNLIWAKRFSTAAGDSGYEVEVDANGNVYVTGISQSGAPGSAENILTIKYDADGNEVWQNLYNSPTDDSDEGFEIELDGAGNVYVLGESYIGFHPTVVIHKINETDGSTVWTKTYDYTGTFEGTSPTAMDLDAQGNIIITGIANLSGETYNIDAFTAKFDLDGILIWERYYDGSNDGDYDGDTKLLLGTDGSIYVGVTSEGFANADMQIIKYTPDGERDWGYRFGNPFFSYDGMMDYGADIAQTAMLLDEGGNVYVAGESFIPGQGINMVAYKLEPLASLRSTAFDFDGDRKADISVYRPETGVWHIINSSDGSYTTTKWGLETDKLVPADFDNDGKYDLGVYRGGTWYVRNSSDGSYTVTNFGLPDDLPVPADFDNDGRADLGVFRQGVWHQLNSADNSYKSFQFGIDTDKPIPSDYDKNRRSDRAVYRDGTWYVSYQAELTFNTIQFGIDTDKPVPADYDGDGQTDYAVFRDGVWYVWYSRSNSAKSFKWGVAGDIPVPADYDGDNKTDFAVYRSGVWYILKSSDGAFTILQFGLETDIPIPSAYQVSGG